MENHRKPPENNPPSKKGVEVMEQLVKEREEEKQKNKYEMEQYIEQENNEVEMSMLIRELRKANEQLRIKNESLTNAITLDEKANDWRQHRISELEKISIVNNNTDMMSAGDLTRLGDVPKQIVIGDYIYAFVEDERLALWIFNVDSWGEVSDLTDVPVWVYQEIKSYAVAIGWINEDKDLFI